MQMWLWQPQEREPDLKNLKFPLSPFRPCRCLNSAGKKKKKKKKMISENHRDVGILLMGPGRIDLFAQGTARGKM